MLYPAELPGRIASLSIMLAAAVPEPKRGDYAAAGVAGAPHCAARIARHTLRLRIPPTGDETGCGMLYHPRMALRSAVLSLLLLALRPRRRRSLVPSPPRKASRLRLPGSMPHGDPMLADGRVLRLVGIAPRQDEEEDKRFRAGMERWRGRPLTLVAARSGRSLGPAAGPAVYRREGGAALDINAALIAAGAARAMAEPAFAPCGARGLAPFSPRQPRRQMLDRARRRRSMAIDGHDIAALKVQAGRFVALSGRIASVGERAQRTYLNLSRRRGEAASIVMSRRLWREMQDAGWTAARLNGRAVRAEGVLSGRDGLLLEITSVSALNVID